MSKRADYAPVSSPLSDGGVIASIDSYSPAQRAGLVPGDTVLSVDGHTLRDIIDWQWLTTERRIALGILRTDGSSTHVTLERDSADEWGVSFSSVLFDAMRTCDNRCAFCFMAQLPRGLRPTLYVRDDDFRLSFLQGNFVTLTNLIDADVDRIAEQRLTPLYVSLHSVDPAIRSRLICAREDRALARFDQLLDAGIDLHVQIVLVPGVNDGADLDRTLTWLAQREGVVSVGIVPLGYTAHQARFTSSYEDDAVARAVIEQVSRWQHAYRERYGSTWVYLADEFYLNARIDVPPTEHYDAFPQYENGIGMVRGFLDDARGLADDLRAAAQALPPHLDVAVVTGALFAPVLAAVLDEIGIAERVSVLDVSNRFFGGNVSVTGLLTSVDIIEATRSGPSRGVYLLPDVIFAAGGRTLDDRTLDDIEAGSAAAMRLVSCDAAGLLAGLLGRAQACASDSNGAPAQSAPAPSTSRGESP